MLHFVEVVLECRMHTDITATVAYHLDVVISVIASIHTPSYTLGSRIAYGMLEMMRWTKTKTNKMRLTKTNKRYLLPALNILVTCTSTYHLGKDFLIECTKTVLSFVDTDDKAILGEGLLLIDQMARDIFECDLDRFGFFRWCVNRFLRKCHSYDARNQIMREILDLL